MTPRTCDELGACQGRMPACEGCAVHVYPFAPGVITGGKLARPGRYWRIAAVIALLWLACFLAGYLL